MKLEKHFERLCDKVTFADSILLEFIDFIMINKKDSCRSYNLLKAILERYYKNDKGFKNTGPIFLDDNTELFNDLRALLSIRSSPNTFEVVKDYPHLFDEFLKCDAGILSEDGRIIYYKLGAEATFFVGMPVYDLSNNKLGILSYICDDEGWYWWKILDYKGKRQEIKTYWQVLKEREENENKV